METQAKKATLELLALTGEWQLSYRVTNRRGVEAFGGFGLTSYSDPATGKEVPLTTPDNKKISTFMIDRPIMKLYPAKNMQQRIYVNWLLRHPEVKTTYNGIEQRFKDMKKPGKISLINMSIQESQKIDDNDYIDKIIGTISITDGKNSFKLSRVRSILAALNLPYKLSKYADDPTTERKFLRRNLKKYVRSSMKNAKEVKALLDNEENAEQIYDIKELMYYGLITESNGMYKIDSKPMGVDMNDIIRYFNNNPDSKITLMSKYHKLKNEK